MPLEDVTQIQVNLTASPITTEGFSTLLIAGTTSPVAAIAEGALAEYTSITEMDDAGWVGSEAEYAAAQDAFAQGLARLKVGHLAAFTARVMTITITVTTDTTRAFTVSDILGRTARVSDGSTGETATQIRDALLALFQATAFDTAGRITFAASGANAITATGDNLGYFFNIVGTAGTATFTIVETTVGKTYSTELAALALVDDDWYGLVGVDADSWHVGSRASFTESRKKAHVFRTADADADDAAVTTDFASLIHAQDYARTLGLYHETAGEYVDAALAAKVLKIDADTQATIWAGQELSGITQQVLTTTRQSALQGKGLNFYSPLDNTRGASYPGKSVGDDWFDLILTSDWLGTRLSEDLKKVWSDRSNAGKKIPYTNHGIGLIENTVRSRVNRGIQIGHVSAGTPGETGTEAPPVYSFPTRAESAAADIANRIYRFTVQAVAAGAIVNMVGTIGLSS